jgi:Flp pilus assembly protein TadD
MKALSDGLQNIYYMGSALYQAQNLEAAYQAFKATYDGYALLKKHNEPNTFDPAEHPKALYYAGLCAQEAGLMKEATAVFEQLVAEGIADAAVYEALVNIYKDSNPALSEKYLMDGRNKYPDDTALLYAEINYYLAKGELISLISKLEKALTLEPNNASVIVTLGQIYDKLYQDNVTKDPAVAEENFNKAMGYYKQALEKDAKNFDAVYSIGALYYNQAAAYSVELNTLANDYTPAGNKKYEAKEKQMNDAFTQALPFFIQAEQLNPNDYNTLIALKEIYARQSKFDEVEIYKQKLEKLNK